MSLEWKLVIIPIVGAVIGWVTNVIAIKMLFWPKKPIKIWGLPVELLGLLPKRKRDLAISVGKIVEEDLLPMDEVVGFINETGYQDQLILAIVSHIDERLKEVLPRFLPENVKVVIRDFIRDIVAKEAKRLIEQVATGMLDKFKEEAHFGQLVQSKIEGLDLDQLEALIMKIASEELRHIEILGAVLGFLIGLLQLGLLAI